MRRIPRTKGALSGFLIVLLGIWAGLVPFVGPYFHYAMHSNQHWQWFTDRFWLEVLPAIVAVVGGLILMGGMTRVSIMFGGLLALAAGLWFIVGPNVSMALRFWHDAARAAAGTSKQATAIIATARITRSVPSRHDPRQRFRIPNSSCLPTRAHVAADIPMNILRNF